MNPNSNRSMLIGVVGGYLIYLAYGLARDLINGVPSEIPKALTVIIVILFAGSGVAILVYAWKLWKAGREKCKENCSENREEEDSATDEEQGTKK